jgi:hypothetical protein
MQRMSGRSQEQQLLPAGVVVVWPHLKHPCALQQHWQRGQQHHHAHPQQHQQLQCWESPTQWI